jgi:hypothetical protein
MGSETARAPLGIMIPSLPEKVIFLTVLAWIWWIPAVLLAGRATVMAVMGRFEPPKTLEILMRIWFACAVMNSVWRMVEFTKTAPVWFWLKLAGSDIMMETTHEWSWRQVCWLGELRHCCPRIDPVAIGRVGSNAAFCNLLVRDRISVHGSNSSNEEYC